MMRKSSTFQVGRYRCTLSIANRQLKAKWEPRKPNDLNNEEVQAYRQGRDAFLVRAVGPGRTLIVEV